MTGPHKNIIYNPDGSVIGNLFDGIVRNPITIVGDWAHLKAE